MRIIHKSPTKPAAAMTAPLSITLSLFGDEYVTHMRNDDNGDGYAGHYFGNYIEALEDFTARTKYLLTGVIDANRVNDYTQDIDAASNSLG